MKKIFLYCVCTLGLISSVKAAVYYVDGSGSDNNSGLQNAPWLTIQKAASTAQAGDTVYVQEGTYAEKVTFNHSGTEDAYITFIGEGSVVVEGTAATTLWSGIFNLNAKSYIRIQNFSIQNSYWFGIYIEGCNHIYLENNNTYNTGASGISVWHSSNVYAAYNRVRKACYQSLTTGSQECITFSGVTDFEIHHNEVFESGGSNNGGEGIDTKEDCSYGRVYKNHVHDLIRLGIYADSWNKILHHLDIYNNRVYNCGDGIVLSSENGGTTAIVNVYNNLTYNNKNFGIVVSNFSDNDNDGLKTKINIMNNTVYNNGFGDNNTSWGGGIIIYSSNVSEISIFNNIVSANDAMQIADGSGVTTVLINNNLIYGYRGHNWTGEVKGTNVIEANPLFVHADGTDTISGTEDDDLHVAAASPAVNAGINNNTPAFDFDFYERPGEGTVDMGAYESNSIHLAIRNVVPTSSTEQLIHVYPNPSSNGEFYVQFIIQVELIEITDITGTIIQHIIKPNDLIVKVLVVHSGVYIMRAYSGDMYQVCKIINSN